jgi:LysM repeat protein
LLYNELEMTKKTKTPKVEKTEEKKPAENITDIKAEPTKSKVDIVITETEEDIVLDSGFNGDPDNLKNAIKKEAAKSDVLSRFLIPLFTFLVIGIVAAGLTWYYARPELTDQKTKEEKIENAPNVKEEPQLQTTPAPAATTPAPAAPAATTSATTYTVQSGDTMSSIANANGLTSKQLADYNGITDVDSLKIGQTLKIPPK